MTLFYIREVVNSVRVLVQYERKHSDGRTKTRTTPITTVAQPCGAREGIVLLSANRRRSGSPIPFGQSSLPLGLRRRHQTPTTIAVVDAATATTTNTSTPKPKPPPFQIDTATAVTTTTVARSPPPRGNKN